MTRPLDPAYTPLTYAPSGNYGAGANPWNGTAKRVAPSGGNASELVPATKLTAQNLNYLLGNGFDVDGTVKTALTDILTMAGQLPALNWFSKVNVSVAVADGVFNPFENAWYLIASGGVDQIRKSVDFGRSFTTPASATSQSFVDIDADLTGKMVLTTQSANLIDYNGSTWTVRTPGLTGTPSGAQVHFVGLWCVMYRNGTSGFQCYTSSDRAAYTSRTANLPAAFTGYTGTNNVQLATNGTRLIACFLNGNTLQCAYSDNGGINWTGFSYATGFTVSGISKPIYSATLSKWFIFVGDNSNSGVLLSSTDGASWTLTKTFNPTTIQFQTIEQLGALLVGCDVTSFGGQVFYSVDQGVTWRAAGTIPAGATSSVKILSGAGGFIMLDTTNSSSIASLRFGRSGTTY